MIGDDDEVTLEHAIAMYRGLPEAELAVVPGTSHGGSAITAKRPIEISMLAWNLCPPIRSALRAASSALSTVKYGSQFGMPRSRSVCSRMPALRLPAFLIVV